MGLEIDGLLASWSSPDTVSPNMIQRTTQGGYGWNVRHRLARVLSAVWSYVNFLQTSVLSTEMQITYRLSTLDLREERK